MLEYKVKIICVLFIQNTCAYFYGFSSHFDKMNIEKNYNIFGMICFFTQTTMFHIQTWQMDDFYEILKIYVFALAKFKNASIGETLTSA